MDETRTRYFIFGLVLLIVIGVAIFGYFWWQIQRKSAGEKIAPRVNEEELLELLKPQAVPKGFEEKATPEEIDLLKSLTPPPVQKQKQPSSSGAATAPEPSPSGASTPSPVPAPTKEEQDLLQLLKPSE